MPPYFIDVGFKTKIGEYLKIPINVLLAWSRENYDPIKVMFIQDCTSAWIKQGRDLPEREPSHVCP